MGAMLRRGKLRGRCLAGAAAEAEQKLLCTPLRRRESRGRYLAGAAVRPQQKLCSSRQQASAQHCRWAATWQMLSGRYS